MANFVHLHTHTAYSLLDGACRIEKLIEEAKKHNQSALAITDHGVMYGVVDFYKEAKKQGIKPIIGCELYIAERTLYEKEYSYDSKRFHVILLAKNNVGYQNLVKLVSIAHVDGFYVKPRIDKNVLRKYSEGLICLSACIAGEIPQAILSNDTERAKQLVQEYVSIFGKENFFLEMQNHGIPEEMQVNAQLVNFAREFGVGIVATNDVHYVRKKDARYQDILMCIQMGKKESETDRMKFETDEMYLKSSEEMSELFKTLPTAIENTVKIADMCNVELEFGKYHLPEFKLPPEVDHFDYLKRLCFDGLKKRYENYSEHIERLKYEVNVINDMGFTDYFLIVWDFVKYAKENGIYVGPGRGSAAGSLVSYCLDITTIDPIKYNLIFERFLNPARITMPDIDMDFCIERRGEVINYVREKYGNNNVAQIITFGTLSARSVIRDVGRVISVPYADVDVIAKMIPASPGQTIENALDENHRLRDKYNSDPKVKELIDIARELEGLPRHASTHAAGVVITGREVSDYVPLALSDEQPITQYVMTTLEELGLLKMDFLGLRNLTVIKNTVNNIKLCKGEELDINKIDMNKKEVYSLIASGNTDGVFQLESAGMKNFMRELKPSCMEDVIAGIALYRPGPADSIPKYIESKNNHNKITYKHPMLQPILESTYGCIVYQEQVMQIVQTMAGYSLGRADVLRKAMGKKKPEVILKEKNAFIYGDDEVCGAVKNGVPADVAESIFNDMADFGKYAFNKSHAAAYAIVAYQTAYLKTFHKVEFMAALMSSQMGNTDKLNEYVAQLPKMGIKLLPVDVNKSYADFTPEGNSIRYGLTAIKNVGRNFAENIIKNRHNGYNSLKEFCVNNSEDGINKRALEFLIKAGSFDNVGNGTRSQYLAIFEKTAEEASSSSRFNFSGQVSFLGSEQLSDDLPKIQPFSKEYTLRLEKEAMGVYLSGHPLDEYADAIEKTSTNNIAEIISSFDGSNSGNVRDGDVVKVGGIITSVNTKITKNNSRMAFVQLEDLYGSIEIVVFPNKYSAFEALVAEGAKVCINGKVDGDDEGLPKILADNITELKMSSNKKAYIKIPKGKESKINTVKELLKLYSGNVPVFIYVESENKYYSASEEYWIEPGSALERHLKKNLGDNCQIIVK